MDQSALIKYHVNKTRSNTNLVAHNQSAFNRIFDNRLIHLVVMYEFNFEAIALHLTYQFPHYEHKITRKSVGYRWYQLEIEARPKKVPYIPQKIENIPEQQNISFNDKKNEEAIHSEQYDYVDKLQVALKIAQNLDQQQLQGFVIYKPRFVIDSDYSLEREKFQHKKIEQIMDNSFVYDFGLFEGVSESAEPEHSLRVPSKNSSEDFTQQSEEANAEAVDVNFVQKYKKNEKDEEYCFQVDDYQSD